MIQIQDPCRKFKGKNKLLKNGIKVGMHLQPKKYIYSESIFQAATYNFSNNMRTFHVFQEKKKLTKSFDVSRLYAWKIFSAMYINNMQSNITSLYLLVLFFPSFPYAFHFSTWYYIFGQFWMFPFILFKNTWLKFHMYEIFFVC